MKCSAPGCKRDAGTRANLERKAGPEPQSSLDAYGLSENTYILKKYSASYTHLKTITEQNGGFENVIINVYRNPDAQPWTTQ